MEINVRGKTYRAEHLTDTHYLTLADVFLDQRTGQFSLGAIEDFDSLPQEDKLRLSQPVRSKLTDPRVKAALADAISSIFPSIPRELVYYGHETYNFNLTIEELTSISFAVGTELGKGKAPLVDEDAIAIAELEKELAQRKAAKGFGGIK